MRAWASRPRQAGAGEALGSDGQLTHCGYGLQAHTLMRLMEKQIETVGALRQLRLRQLWSILGKSSIQDIVRTLTDVGMTLESNPTQLEKWRFSAITKDDLVRPEETAPIKELMPWLGSLPERFEKAGVSTVAQLRESAAAGGMHVRGVGPSSWERVFNYFGVRPGRSRQKASA
jgi:hypothetical protein